MASGDLGAALLDAARDGNASEAARLLAAGADPDAADEQVHMCSGRGGCMLRCGCMRMTHGHATRHCPLLQGLSVLHVAAVDGRTRLIRTLLQAGASPFATAELNGYLPIHAAVESGHLAAARLLLDEAPQAATAVGTHGFTPLHVAAGGGHLELVRLLLGVAPEAAMMKNADGSVPLFLAALEGHASMVRGCGSAFARVVSLGMVQLTIPVNHARAGAPVAGRCP